MPLAGMASKECADSSRVLFWVNAQRKIVQSRRRDVQDLGSFPQCCRRSVSPPPSKSNCPPQALQTVSLPTSQDPTSRKRRWSMPAIERTSSPRKRPRGPEGDLGISPSASSRNVTVLDTRTVLSATSAESTSSPRRNNSPTRDHAIELRTASPAIRTDNIIGVALPKRVRELRKLLINDFGRCFIPAGLKACLSPRP